MIHECGLKPSDMFLPKPDGKKPIQVRGFKSKSERKELDRKIEGQKNKERNREN